MIQKNKEVGLAQEKLKKFKWNIASDWYLQEASCCTI